jgi:hypothetical protein
MKTLVKTLADINTSIEELNSSDIATRKAARVKLGNAYPNARLTVELSDAPALKFPVTINGKQYSKPLMNTLTAAGFRDSTIANRWTFIGFSNDSKIGTPNVVNTPTPIKTLKTVAENVDISDLEIELQKEEQKRVQNELYAKYMRGEVLTVDEILIIQGLIPANLDTSGENEGGEKPKKPKKVKKV